MRVARLDVFLLKSHNYKLITSVGISAGVMKPVVSLLGMGASPNLTRMNQFPKDWPQSLQNEKTPYSVKSATNPPIPGAGSMRLLIQVCSLALRARFLSVQDMYVPCTLETAHMDQHFEALNCRGKNVGVLRQFGGAYLEVWLRRSRRSRSTGGGHVRGSSRHRS